MTPRKPIKSKLKFTHRSLELKKDKKLVYTALSKHYFYFRMFISKFVLEQGAVPLNPFMIFDYFLLGSLDRDIFREGNNNLVKRSDELWVFGEVSDGVLAEIKIAQAMKKPIKYFHITSGTDIFPIKTDEVKMEDDVKLFKNELTKIK